MPEPLSQAELFQWERNLINFQSDLKHEPRLKKSLATMDEMGRQGVSIQKFTGITVTALIFILTHKIIVLTTQHVF